MYKQFLLLILMMMISCGKETLPKPKGYLSLQYPKKEYVSLSVNRPYTFEVAQNITIVELPNNWLKIIYPDLKASIDITYRPINNNLKELLMEAEKLVFEHTIKADQIGSNNYENKEKRVFGTIYDITGNSASHLQFHVTDSAHHFLKASLFFKSKPNYDSILPAVDYLKQDMIKMMETLEWN